MARVTAVDDSPCFVGIVRVNIERFREVLEHHPSITLNAPNILLHEEVQPSLEDVVGWLVNAVHEPPKAHGHVNPQYSRSIVEAEVKCESIQMLEEIHVGFKALDDLFQPLP